MINATDVDILLYYSVKSWDVNLFKMFKYAYSSSVEKCQSSEWAIVWKVS